MLGVFSANINMSIGIIGRIKTSEKKTDRQVVSDFNSSIICFLWRFFEGQRKREGDKRQTWKKNPIFVVIFLDFCFLRLEIKKRRPLLLHWFSKLISFSAFRKILTSKVFKKQQKPLFLLTPMTPWADLATFLKILSENFSEGTNRYQLLKLM